MSDGSTRKGISVFFANTLTALIMVWWGFYLETIPEYDWMVKPCFFTALFVFTVGFVVMIFDEEVDR